MRLTKPFDPLLKPALELISLTMKSRLFAILLCIDFIFLAMHIYVATRPWEVSTSPIEYLRIDKDLGLSEVFEYFVLAGGLIATLILIKRTRDRAYWIIAAVMLYFLIDDAFSVHEIFGRSVDRDDPNIAEAIPSLIAGAIFGLAGGISLYQSRGTARAILIAFGLCVAFIAFFAVGVDTLHGLYIRPFSPLDGPITLIEDGSELVGLTFLSALLLTVQRRFAAPSRPSRSTFI